MISHLITHSGTFHGDDVLAYCLLRDLHPQAQLLRTRDSDKMQSLQNSAIIFDVGDVYSPEKNMFDHHQNGAPVRDDGIPYSAVGLVWKHFGKEWLKTCAEIPEPFVDAVHQQMDTRFIKRVDAMDNGVIGSYDETDMDITSMIYRANIPTLTLDGKAKHVTPTEQDAQFTTIAGRMRPLLHHYAQDMGRNEVAKDILKTAMEARTNPKLLVLDVNVPWTDSLFDQKGHEEVLFVCSPSSSGEWSLQCAPTTRNGLEMRRGFPQAWRGLRNDDIAQASGNDAVHFCHRAGFMCAGNSKEGMIKLAEQTFTLWRQEDIKQTLSQRAAETVGTPTGTAEAQKKTEVKPKKAEDHTR